MKLELKHLAPYFPYGLKCQFKGMLNNKIEIGRIHKLSENSVSFQHNMFWQIENCKPILRPLSEINSKHHSKFRENYHIDFDNSGGFIFKRINETYTRFNELDYFFENHFDVFGLIEKGLAVSIHDVV
jgi:hypothetical protein